MLPLYLSLILGIGFGLIIIFLGKAAAMCVFGLVTIFCATMNYDWFVNHRRAAPFVALFGRDGARVFYIVFGIVIIVLALVYKAAL